MEKTLNKYKMSKEVVITNYKNRYLIAYLENNKAIELFLKSPDSIEIGDIYIGKVKNIVENIQAAFVEVSPGIIGYYSLKNNTNHLFTCPTNRKLSIGDEIMVQIERGSIKSKAPVLSSHIQIQGNCMVLLGNYPFIGVSKKISSSHIRDNLKFLAHEFVGDSQNGIIFRTEAQNTNEKILREEYDSLLVDYNKIMSTFRMRTCYSKIYGMPQNWLKYVHANNLHDLRIVTDLEDVFDNLMKQDYISDKNNLCEFYSDKTYSLIKLKSLETQIDRAVSKHVWLRSGASLVIEPTEALTSIDVNTSKTEIRKKDESTFLEINIEAAHEIFRQIRLRNLSGIIIVDFINLSDKKNEILLMNTLKLAAQEDPVQTNVIDITPLGLVEITRKRTYRPFYEQLKEYNYE